MKKVRIKVKEYGRQHITSSGRPKVRFLTEFAAQRAIDDICSRRPEAEFDIYICDICHYIHIGRRAKPENRYWPMLMEAKMSKFDEREIGKLVALLRKILDKPV
jgi:hypothetical protein